MSISANIDSNQAVPNCKWFAALQQPESGARCFREDAKAKRGNYLIGFSLRSCMIRESLVGYLWLVVLLSLEAFTGIDSGLGFSLLTQGTKVLEPPQSNGLLVRLLQQFCFWSKLFISSTLVFSLLNNTGLSPLNFGVIYKGIPFWELLSLSRSNENKRHLALGKANQFLLRVWIFPVFCQLDTLLFSRMTSYLLLWKGNVACHSSKWRILPAIPVLQWSSHQPLQPPHYFPRRGPERNSEWRKTGSILCFGYWP